MLWSRVILLAVLGWSQSVVADVKFTMLYITNPVIYTGTPFQIVWTGAQGLVNVTLVDAVDGSKTPVQSNASGTTFDWVSLESLNGHRGSLVITDGLSTDTTAVFSFKDNSGEGVVSSSPPSQSQSLSVMTPSSTVTTRPALAATTASVSSSQLSTSLQSPTALTIPPTSAPTTTTSSTDSGNGLSLGAEVGIAIGAILLTAIGAAMLLYLFWFRKRQQISGTPQEIHRGNAAFMTNSGYLVKDSPYGSSPSVSELGKAGPYVSSRSLSEMTSTVTLSPNSPILTTSPNSRTSPIPTSPFPRPSPVPRTLPVPRTSSYADRIGSEDLQGSREGTHMVEDKSLRSDMLREFHRN